MIGLWLTSERLYHADVLLPMFIIFYLRVFKPLLQVLARTICLSGVPHTGITRNGKLESVPNCPVVKGHSPSYGVRPESL
jgi:hypothetical protein